MALGVQKEASLWQDFVDLFRPEAKKAREEVKAHLQSQDPKKWDRFLENAVASPDFIQQLKRNATVDNKTVTHAVSMSLLHAAPPVGEVSSTSEPGKSYQIRALPGDLLGCTCNDWKFKGSVQPGYECKHIKAHKMSQSKTASFKKQTSAFFDELAKIRDQQKKDATSGLRGDYAQSSSPYAGLLVQGEEPAYYNTRPAAAPEDPEVILRGMM